MARLLLASPRKTLYMMFCWIGHAIQGLFLREPVSAQKKESDSTADIFPNVPLWSDIFPNSTECTNKVSKREDAESAMTFENAFLGEHHNNTNIDRASSILSQALEDSKCLYSLLTIQKHIKRKKKAITLVFLKGFRRPGPPILLLILARKV